MSESIQHTEWYKTGFDRFEKSLNGEAKSSMHRLRRSGLDEFSRTGFPSSSNEEWRFTNISSIAKTEFEIIPQDLLPKVSTDDLKSCLAGDAPHHVLVFINGHFSIEHSSIRTLPKGARIEPLSSVVAKEETLSGIGTIAALTDSPFNALNTAFIRDGVTIQLNDGVVLEEPIYCLFLSTAWQKPYVVQPRNFLVFGKNSRATIVEQYIASEDNIYFTNAVTEISLGEHANILHTKIQSESNAAYHISTMHIRQKGGSVFTSNSVALGGKIVRNNILSVLDGEFIECTLNGLSLGTGEQLIDNHTTIDHAQPNCVSHELYKAILDGKSRGVFNGKIYVRKDAQKTDAKQTNKTLLLSDDAIMDTKPQLEIFADDVKCTHGATIGQLDDEQIFYLRSRGFSRDLARDILTTAFANSVIDRINDEKMRERLYELIFQKLHQGRNAAIA